MANNNQKLNLKLWPTIGIILSLVFIFNGCDLLPPPDYTISVIDKNNTDKIEIIIKNDTHGGRWEEKTDSKGVWTKKFKFNKNDKITILFKKQGYKIEPPSFTGSAHQLHKKPIYIEATQQGNDITFKVKNGLAGVKVLQKNYYKQPKSQTLLPFRSNRFQWGAKSKNYCKTR